MKLVGHKKRGECFYMILCSVGEIIIFELYYDTMILILSSYVLLACINTIYKYGHAWVI